MSRDNLRSVTPVVSLPDGCAVLLDVAALETLRENTFQSPSTSSDLVQCFLDQSCERWCYKRRPSMPHRRSLLTHWASMAEIAAGQVCCKLHVAFTCESTVRADEMSTSRSVTPCADKQEDVGYQRDIIDAARYRVSMLACGQSELQPRLL